MPGSLKYVYPHMRDWLPSYRELRGIEITLTNMSHRFSRRPHLESAVHLLTDSRAVLEQHFRRFFPDVIEYAK
jgi:acyl carrier protein phosphodiesterase